MHFLLGVPTDLMNCFVKPANNNIYFIANKKFSYCLLKSAALTLSIELIAPIVPRLSLSAFNFTLPWLMRRLLTYVRDKESETAEEAGGLVGAFVIVYLGLAVCWTFEFDKHASVGNDR